MQVAGCRSSAQVPYFPRDPGPEVADHRVIDMRKLFFVVLAAALVTAGVSAQRFGHGVTLSGGDHLLYVGTYAGTVQIFDEAREQKIGEIKLRTGIPRSLMLSQNRQQLLRARFHTRARRGRGHRDAHVARATSR